MKELTVAKELILIKVKKSKMNDLQVLLLL